MIMMVSHALEKKTRTYALKLHKKKLFPAAVVGAEYKAKRVVDISKPCNVTMLHKLLYEKLKTLGILFTKVNDNFLGCCAEVNAANRVLVATLKLNKIEFSDAIRPRTMQKIEMCENCKLTFDK